MALTEDEVIDDTPVDVPETEISPEEQVQHEEDWQRRIEEPRRIGKLVRQLNRQVFWRRTKQIPLRNRWFKGLTATVDSDLYAKVAKHRWRAVKMSYAFLPARVEAGKLRFLGQDILEAVLGPVIPDGLVAVTSDGRGLNCCTHNLEVMTIEDAERRAPPHYSGVEWSDEQQRWNGRWEHQIDAALDHDRDERCYWLRNFPNLKVDQKILDLWEEEKNAWLRQRWRAELEAEDAKRISQDQEREQERLQRLTRLLKAGCSKAKVRDLGCSVPQFREWLEFWFQPGMTWENLGTEWHIGYCKPYSAFFLCTLADFAQVHHFGNLQPLWIEDKGASA